MEHFLRGHQCPRPVWPVVSPRHVSVAVVTLEISRGLQSTVASESEIRRVSDDGNLDTHDAPSRQDDRPSHIGRWAFEKLGLTVSGSPPAVPTPLPGAPSATAPAASTAAVPAIKAPSDIKTFVEAKAPASDMQFAAAVAYYYAFEAPEDQRKEQLRPDDLQAACRLTGRGRLANPIQTFRNATYHGLLDKGSEKGALRKHVVDGASIAPPADSSDAPPDFSLLIGDPKMQSILSERWTECVSCLSANAPLAATVMMGGLLETLMLARFNRETDKTPVFSATMAPKDKNTGKTLQLKEWTLRHYLDVGHELGWISRSTKDVGEVVRDFRNYVHPYKQMSHNISLDTHDARLFWGISKEISRQLLSKAGK